MALSVTHVGTTPTGGGSSLTFSPSQTLPVGSVVVITTCSGSNTQPSATDTAGNSWTAVIHAAGGPSATVLWSILTHQLTTSSTITLTISASQGNFFGYAFLVSGWPVTPHLDVTGSTGTTGNNISVSTARTQYIYEVAFAVGGGASAGNPWTGVPGSPWVDIETGAFPCCVAYQILTSNTTLSASFSASSNLTAAIATFGGNVFYDIFSVSDPLVTRIPGIH